MQDSSEQTQTYLHEDVEVIKTGRTAQRKLRNDRIDERVEITPKTNTQGIWKKWVRETDLYKIE